ncbi:MAG: Crp/Fnr family transcriptional regulator [Christensenellales bacterium]|nr:Crp/Fnr family transcriptional regulator [Clostridiales bacterium]
MNFLKLIRKNCLFDDFSDKEINTLFDCMKGRIVMKSKGMLIAKEDSKAEEICIVLEGTLLKFITKLNGEKEPVGMLSQGEMFGMEQFYLEDKRIGFNVVAASEVSLLYLQTNSIVTMCEKACPCHQKLIHKALQYLSRRIEDLQNNNNYITIKGMRLKIAQLIYDKYLEQNSLQLSLGMDRNEMAAFLNVSRPSMSREMMRMRDEGIMEFWKDKITIKNIQKLTAIVKRR